MSMKMSMKEKLNGTKALFLFQNYDNGMDMPMRIAWSILAWINSAVIIYGIIGLCQ